MTANADVLFDFNSATLTASGHRSLARAAALLTTRADPTKTVTVTGYTDSIGADAYNETLSARRAAAVVTALQTSLATVCHSKLSGRGRCFTCRVTPCQTEEITRQAGALNRASGRFLYSQRHYGQPSATAEIQRRPARADQRRVAPGFVTTIEGVTLPAEDVGQLGEQTPTPMSATVDPLVRDGSMTLEQADITSSKEVSPQADFSVDYLLQHSTSPLST